MPAAALFRRSVVVALGSLAWLTVLSRPVSGQAVLGAAELKILSENADAIFTRVADIESGRFTFSDESGLGDFLEVISRTLRDVKDVSAVDTKVIRAAALLAGSGTMADGILLRFGNRSVAPLIDVALHVKNHNVAQGAMSTLAKLLTETSAAEALTTQSKTDMKALARERLTTPDVHYLELAGAADLAVATQDPALRAEAEKLLDNAELERRHISEGGAILVKTIVRRALARFPPTPDTAARPAPIRVGGSVQKPLKTKSVAPVYPAIALSALVQGSVSLEITVSGEGKVVGANVISGPILLREAAIDAVKQWEYAPTRVNGAPVSVIMTETVAFAIK